jgi:chromosome partitioning protein
MITLAIYNLKGGVGKTASAVNLAYLSAKEGYRTLVWDLDPQGSASFYFGSSSSVKNESKKLLNGELELSEAIQDSNFEGSQTCRSIIKLYESIEEKSCFFIIRFKKSV